jgi:8-oxo-dGTP diphosphatase
MREINHFNLRVYAIIRNEANEILVSDEFQQGQQMTKFPGGGLQFGEGTIECLEREAREEFGQEIRVLQHFYTTDFYQKALFHDDQQLISIYYEAKFLEPIRFRISKKAFDFEKDIDGSQSFRWISVMDLDSACFTFPVDKVVSGMLKKSKD